MIYEDYHARDYDELSTDLSSHDIKKAFVALLGRLAGLFAVLLCLEWLFELWG